MKEFDEWYKNYPPTTHYLPQYEYGKLVWEAALEWALKNLENQYEQLSDTFECGWFGYFIEKELEDE